jgi:hypothetical protein
MEIRMVLEPDAAAYIKAVSKARSCTNGAAINRLIVEVIKQGGMTIIDHVPAVVGGDHTPVVDDDEPQL